MRYQTTLNAPISFSGVGLHTGWNTSVTIRPAPIDTGILFNRRDFGSDASAFHATHETVIQSALCTKITNGIITISTVEHLMGALAGCDVFNAFVDVNGPEIPIMDGSALDFVQGIQSVGLNIQNKIQLSYRIIKPIEVESKGASIRLEPADGRFFDFFIDFEDTFVNKQYFSFELTKENFIKEICSARTFCREQDLPHLQQLGLAKGGSTQCAVILGKNEAITEGGLRYSNEPVRHKILDAIGDLSMTRFPIIGRYIGNRAGHALTAQLLKEISKHDKDIILVEALR